MKKIILLFIGLLSISSVNAQGVKSGRIIFYNTENLFDTIKAPNTDDVEFTPTGKAQWTTERYQHKLTNISKALGAVSESAPLIAIGLCEIENRKVAEELLHQPALSGYDLGVIEHDSPDPRGIDVALLYNKKLFSVTDTAFLTVKLRDTTRGTRDILYVRGSVNGVELHLFVNHWPSRRTGRLRSEPDRCTAAMIIRNKVAMILATDSTAHIIIMGDLNDNPTDSSIANVLIALSPHMPVSPDSLYDLMAKPYHDGKYTLKYRGENDVFDQMIVSGNLIDKSIRPYIKNESGGIFDAKWLLFSHPKYSYMPSRTYSGTLYHGGFSDHLPVYIDLVFD